MQQVARRLKLSFTEDQKTQLSKNSTESAEAYQLYLKGRFFLNKRTAEGFERAMEFFREAIAQAPSYAPAYAGLATTYLLQAAYDVRRPKEASNLRGPPRSRHWRSMITRQRPTPSSQLLPGTTGRSMRKNI